MRLRIEVLGPGTRREGVAVPLLLVAVPPTHRGRRVGSPAVKKKKGITPIGWDETESRAFRDGCRRRAKTIPSLRRVAAKNACRDRRLWD